ncbi:hypothetical protein [Paenibacillus montanisoli]|uniref:Uncharacterized protein n=1 Tax=Paenibacillus montanisoli TaxID=2081970 RepID=A0A328U3X6_9BACL|nr:hypothetical protein [Paenibacillus montanisoli]RAP77320.1 hypothetical protein DL346_02150 [Paenibacillus montanisoli]
MGKFVIMISTIVCLLTGCSEHVKPDVNNVANKPAVDSHAEVAEGDFVYRLVSEKSAYAEGEKVEVYAELEYVGDQPEIKIAHAASPFSFPMKEQTRGYDLLYMMDQPLIVSVLKKGEPLREPFKGAGGYGSQDPKDYVDFMKSVAEATQKGTLPWGDYRVFGSADFEPISGSEENQDNDRLSLKAEIGFIVEKPKLMDKANPILHEETVGELKYEIRLSKDHFEMNEEIVVDAKVTNLGKEPLTYVVGSSSCPTHINVRIINQESKKYLAFKPVDQACTDDISNSQLEPSQTIAQTFKFVPKFYGKSDLEPALPGTYDVVVSLPPAGIEITEDYQSKPINERPKAKVSIILH